MRNTILAFMIFTAGAAYAQFTGGGCPTGGFVDRYSDQSVSGQKIFCSTATFNNGLVVGLNPVNALSISAQNTPSGPLYWGNKQVCDTSGNCPGVGPSLPPDFPDDYLRFLVPGGPGGTVNRLSIFDSTYTVTNSVIEQDDGTDTIIINDYYSLTMFSTSTIPTIYTAEGITTTQDFGIHSNNIIHLISSDAIGLIATTDIQIGPTQTLDIQTSTLSITASSLILNGTPTISTVFKGGDCGGGQFWRLTILGGLVTGTSCY